MKSLTGSVARKKGDWLRKIRGRERGGFCVVGGGGRKLNEHLGWSGKTMLRNKK